MRDQLRHHDRSALIDQYRLDRIPHLASQVVALDTWRRWAWGDSIDVKTLDDAVDTLMSAGGHYRALARVVQEWSENAGIRLSRSELATPTPDPGPSLEV